MSTFKPKSYESNVRRDIGCRYGGNNLSIWILVVTRLSDHKFRSIIQYISTASANRIRDCEVSCFINFIAPSKACDGLFRTSFVDKIFSFFSREATNQKDVT